MVRALDLLRRAASPQDSWAKHDLYDALFYVRILLAALLGTGFGYVGAQGLMVFLLFLSVNIFVGNAWLRWQGIDEAEYEDPDKISQSPLTFEGFAPALSTFVLLWVTIFTLAHPSTRWPWLRSLTTACGHYGPLGTGRQLRREPLTLLGCSIERTSRALPALTVTRSHSRADSVSSSSSNGGGGAGGGPPVDGDQVDLDWKLGVALAGASFEAYGLLAQPGLSQHHACGADTHYLDREFLRCKQAGLLQVTIRRAVSLPAADPAPFTSDPYLVVCVGDSCFTTRTILNNLNPEWHETCTLFVRNPKLQTLTVRVFDYDFGAEDDFLGSAVADVQPLCDGRQHDLELQLRGSPFAAKGGSRDDGLNGEEDSQGSGKGGSGGDGQASSEATAKAASRKADDSTASSEADRSANSGSSSGSGSVQLSCRFLPFDELLADEVAEPAVDGTPMLATPGEIPLAQDWQRVMELAGVVMHARFDAVAYIENVTTNTQCYIHWNREQRQVCVAFRGTEQGKWKDIMTDLHLVPAPLDPDRIATARWTAALSEVSQPPEEPSSLLRILSTVEQAKEQVAQERAAAEAEAGSTDEVEEHILETAVKTIKSTAEDVAAVLERVRQQIAAAQEEDHEEDDQPWVHSGFLTAYDSLRPALLGLLAAILDGEQRQWTVQMTGHSLGGALATLAAWDCAHRSWACAEAPELVVVNFGSPRVGNRAFADSYNALVPRTWRVVNAKDTVCTVPRLMGYAHVGNAIYLTGEGRVEVVMNSTHRLGEGLGMSDLTPALQATVGAVVAAKVPELLPEVATTALKKVGIEVALAGSADEEPAASAADVADAGSSDSGSRAAAAEGSGAAQTAAAAAEALTPDALSEIWEQEMEAWSVLLDGSGLNEHMEDLYLENLRKYLESIMRGNAPQQEGQQGADQQQQKGVGSVRAAAIQQQQAPSS